MTKMHIMLILICMMSFQIRLKRWDRASEETEREVEVEIDSDSEGVVERNDDNESED